MAAEKAILCVLVVLCYCNIYHYNQRSIEKFMKVSLHNTIAKCINMYIIFMLH